MSPIAIEQVVEPYVRRRRCSTSRKARSSSSRPAPATRSSPPTPPPRCAGAEIGAEVVLKATKVDGVYTADPKKDPTARRYGKITFDEAMAQNLGIMDATAFALCRDQKLPIKVFSIFKHGALRRVVMARTRARWCTPEDRGRRTKHGDDDCRDQGNPPRARMDQSVGAFKEQP